MDSLERCMKAICHEEVDRVPVVPLVISHAVKLANVPFCQYNTDPKLLVDCQIAAWRKYEYDGIHVTTDNWVLPQAFGVQVQFYADLPPTGLTRPLARTKDLSVLPSIEKAKRAARMNLLPAATRYAREIVGDTCFIKANFDQGPFSLCSSVRGIEQLMADMYDDEQFVLDLQEICSELVFQLGLAVGQAGAHALTFGDSVAGLISRKDYIKYAYPFEKNLIERLHMALDIPVFLHICGNASHILDCMADTGADALELDHYNDFLEVKKQIGARTCLEGNLDPTRVMFLGTPEVVRQESAKLISIAGMGGGFILSPGCEVPRDTPSENMLALVKAARDFS
jgi:uroporphyrinogen decarboxylase